MQDIPFVFVIILNYMRAQDTIDCVRTLKDSTYPSLRLIVVDNASPDSSAELIHQAIPDIEILHSKKNTGYAGGMNLGITYALQFAPKYLLVLNSDTLVDREYTYHLVSSLEANIDAACAAGTIYHYPDKGKIWYAGGKLIKIRGSGFSTRKAPDKDVLKLSRVENVTFISGCAFLIRAEAIKKAGAFDERFFMYLEDTELCARLLHAGFRLLYVPCAKIFHKVDEDEITPFRLYYSVRNRFLFVRTSIYGLQKLYAYIYIFVVFFMKMLVWNFIKPELFCAAKFGIEDHFKNIYYEGRGVMLAQRMVK